MKMHQIRKVQSQREDSIECYCKKYRERKELKKVKRLTSEK